MKQLEQNQDDYVWGDYETPKKLLETRLKAMDAFLEDFEAGKAEKRYVAGELPTLPFADQAFDLVVSSYCLFTYSHHLDLDFHVQSIKEMRRVGKEIRLFPLLQLDGKKSPFVEPVLKMLTAAAAAENNICYAIETVPYEFQRGGNEMLSIRCLKC